MNQCVTSTSHGRFVIFESGSSRNFSRSSTLRNHEHVFLNTWLLWTRLLTTVVESKRINCENGEENKTIIHKSRRAKRWMNIERKKGSKITPVNSKTGNKRDKTAIDLTKRKINLTKWAINIYYLREVNHEIEFNLILLKSIQFNRISINLIPIRFFWISLNSIEFQFRWFPMNFIRFYWIHS